MEFRTRISYKLASSLVMALFLIAFDFFNARNIPDSWSVLFMLIPLFLVIRLLFYRKYIYLFLTKKPALVITESYIYDAAEDIKFYRDEIDTLYDDSGYLWVKLIEPEHSAENEVYRATLFKINLDLIQIDVDKLTEIIDNFDKRQQTNEANSNPAIEVSYQFKWGRKTLWLVFQFIFWCLFLVLSNFRERHKGYDWVFFLVFAMAVLILPQIVKFLYFWISRKPVLTANRSFIYDQFKNIKYYWNDIDEVVVTGDYMAVKLYRPEKYIDEIKNPIDRFFTKMRYDRFHKKPAYSINMDIVGVKAEDYSDFLNTLNEFSITGT